MTGLDGGGFQNVVAIAPGSSDTVLSGGDVSGINRSNDLGVSYQISNVGLTSGGALKIAALAYHPSIPGKVYAAAGHEGNVGGLFVSTDDGRSWTLRSEIPQFSGNNNTGVAGLPAPHPRSTGNLIAIDGASGTIWVATFKDGVMRSTDDGATWATLGLAGKYLRSLALDPADPNVAYAAAYGDGVWKTVSASGSGSFGKLAGSPEGPEELVVLAGRVFVAAGPAGIHESRDGGSTWAAVNRGTIPLGGETVWTSIAGYKSGGSAVLFVGSMNPQKFRGSPNFATIFKSTDGGASWAPVTGRSEVHYEVLGGKGPWWLSSVSAQAMVDKHSAITGAIAIDPSNHENVFIAGRGGLWRSTNGGGDWYPSVGGMGVTVNDRVLADPRVPG
ncbi:MAG: WD40/YVTN/BNR-like repeat-containing protein, partial [Actinomycetota bacterium]